MGWLSVGRFLEEAGEGVLTIGGWVGGTVSKDSHPSEGGKEFIASVYYVVFFNYWDSGDEIKSFT